MKRILALILAFSMGLALGLCIKKPAPASDPVQASEPMPMPTAEPTPQPTPEPTPTPVPEPTWEPGYCRLGNWGLLWTTYHRGDEVTLLGRWNDYYIVEGEEADLLVEKRFIRWDGEDVPGEKDGWSQSDTAVYSSGYLFGTPMARLPLNTQVRVVDTKANWAYIEWDGGSGYVDATHIHNQPFTVYTGGGNNAGGSVPNLPAIPAPPSGGGSPSDGTDVNMGELASFIQSPPEISLLGVYSGPEYETFAPCPAVILSDETEAYLCFLIRADELKVTEVGEECAILVNGLVVNLPRWALSLENDEKYAPWLAYAESGAVAYCEYQRKNSLVTFGLNNRVWVIDEIKELGLYVVEIDGAFGYVKTDDLSRFELITYIDPSPNGGGSFPGDSGGGIGGIPSGSDWTPPNL